MNLYWQTRLISLVAGLLIGIGGACQLFSGNAQDFLDFVIALGETLFGLLLIYVAFSPADGTDTESGYIHPDSIQVPIPNQGATSEDWDWYYVKLGEALQFNYRLANQEMYINEFTYYWQNYGKESFEKILTNVSPNIQDMIFQKIRNEKKKHSSEREDTDLYEWLE